VHGHSPTQAFDDTQDIPALIRERHAVDDPHGALIGLEFGFQYQGAVAVFEPNVAHLYGRPVSQRPCPGPPSNAAKHAPRIKSGKQSQSMEPSRPTSATQMPSAT
jgi:hypothetical protein